MAAPSRWPAAPFLAGPAIFGGLAPAPVPLLPRPQPRAADPARLVFEPLRQQSPVPRRAFAAPHSRAFQFLDSELCELGDTGGGSSSDSYCSAAAAPTNGSANVVMQPGEAIVPARLRGEQLPPVQVPRLAPPAFRLLFAESYRHETSAAYTGGSGGDGGFGSGAIALAADNSSRSSAFESSEEATRSAKPRQITFVPPPTPPAEQWPVLDPFNNGDRIASGGSFGNGMGFDVGAGSRSSVGYDSSVDRDSMRTGGGAHDTSKYISTGGGTSDTSDDASRGFRDSFGDGSSLVHNGHSDTSGNSAYPSRPNQFAAATWTRPQHIAPTASAINPSLRDTAPHVPDFRVFSSLQQAAAPAKRGWRIQESVLDRLSPDASSPIQSRRNSVSSPRWRLTAAAAPARAPAAPPLDRSMMSVEEQNEELNRAARTLISDEFLRGLSDVHVFSRGLEPVRQTSGSQPTPWQQPQQQPLQLPLQLQLQLEQQLQRQEELQQQQQLQRQQQQLPPQPSYLKIRVPGMSSSNGHMPPPGANRVGGSAASHARRGVAAETRVADKRKAPVKRKRAKDADAGGQRPAQMPVPTYYPPPTAFAAAAAPPPAPLQPLAEFATAAMTRTPMLPTPSSTGDVVARPLAPSRPSTASSAMPTPILSVSGASPVAPASAPSKPKKKTSAGRAQASSAPILSKHMIAGGWFIPEPDGKKKKKAPPARRKTTEEPPPKNKPRKVAAPVALPVHKPSPRAGSTVSAVLLAPTGASGPETPLRPSATPSAASLVVPAAVSDATVVTGVKRALETIDLRPPVLLPVPAPKLPGANADVETIPIPANVAIALPDIVWSRAASGTAAAEPAAPVSPLPSPHPNNTIMIFCKRDFLRYQAAKLWKKYEEKKRKKEFQTVQVLGKRTRYVNARYEDERPAPAAPASIKAKKPRMRKRARKLENPNLNPNLSVQAGVGDSAQGGRTLVDVALAALVLPADTQGLEHDAAATGDAWLSSAAVVGERSADPEVRAVPARESVATRIPADGVTATVVSPVDLQSAEQVKALSRMPTTRKIAEITAAVRAATSDGADNNAATEAATATVPTVAATVVGVATQATAAEGVVEAVELVRAEASPPAVVASEMTPLTPTTVATISECAVSTTGNAAIVDDEARPTPAWIADEDAGSSGRGMRESARAVGTEGPESSTTAAASASRVPGRQVQVATATKRAEKGRRALLSATRASPAAVANHGKGLSPPRQRELGTRVTPVSTDL